MTPASAEKMKILIVYFSRTGCVAKLAGYLRARLVSAGEVLTIRIEPEKPCGYWGWLVRSFIPWWRTPIRPGISDLGQFDLVFLGFPKWTFSCPPVNQYIREMRSVPGKDFGLFMSYGGFDGERFLKSMARQVRKKGGRIVATVSVRKSAIPEGSFRQVLDAFCLALIERGNSRPSR